MLVARIRSMVTRRWLGSNDLWGDGFADDEWSSVCRAESWESVDVQELFRFMPNLPRHDGPPWPKQIRLAFLSAAEVGRDSTEPNQFNHLLFCRLLGSDSSQLPKFSEDAASAVAYVSGIHPAYVWHEASLSHDRYATIAWLGSISSHYSALIPHEVASSLADIIVVSEDKQLSVRDGYIGSVLTNKGFLKRLYASVKNPTDSFNGCREIRVDGLERGAKRVYMS